MKMGTRREGMSWIAFILAAASMLLNVGCASGLSSCSKEPSDARHLPYRAFVGVASGTTFMSEKCAEGMTPPCIDQNVSLGSGMIIRRSESNRNIAYILTAKHICDHRTERPEGAIAELPISQSFSVMDQDGKEHPARYFFSSSKPLVDACILIIDDMDDTLDVAHVAPVGPLQGEMVYNIAAPGGFLKRGVALTFSGFFVGNDGPVDVYTLPSAGGSSGSPILNDSGQVIGMIWGYPVRRDGSRIIEPISYSVTHGDILNIDKSIDSADVIIDALKTALEI